MLSPDCGGLRDVEKDVVGEVMTSRAAYEVLLDLCDTYGHRFAGSPECRRAGAYIAKRWRELGLRHVRREPFEFTAWRRGPARLEVLEPVRRTLECIGLPNTPATPKGGIVAEFASVGDGTPDEFARAGKSLRGKMVMASSQSPPHQKRWIHRMEKFGRSIGAGARAFLFVNHVEGLLPATGSLMHGGGRIIPGVGIAKETGAYLDRLAAKGPVKLKLTVGGRMFTTTTHNIVGEIVGRRFPDEIVLTGAHYDGHDISQGAHDNASGVAAVTEAARVLAPHAARIDRTIRFVAFGAEEVGLVGSGRYAADHADELDAVRFMLNVDGAAGAGPFGLSLDRWPDLAPTLTEIGRDMCYPLTAGQGIGIYSDNYAFFLAGVPTGTLSAAPTGIRGRGFGHTAADTVDKPPMRNLQEAATVVARVLLHVANLERWPVRRRRPASAVKRLLQEENLIETLNWEKRNPFARAAGKKPPKGYW